MIVELEFDRSRDGPCAAPRWPSGRLKATASNVFQNQEEFTAGQGVRWRSGHALGDGCRNARGLDRHGFGQPESFSGVRIREEYAGRVRRFELERKEGAGVENDLRGHDPRARLLAAVPGHHLRETRLNILEATEGPTLSEIEFIEGKGQ